MSKTSFDAISVVALFVGVVTDVVIEWKLPGSDPWPARLVLLPEMTPRFRISATCPE